MPDELTLEERQALLDLARRSIEAAVNGRPLPLVHGQGLPERLLERGASFVTLTNRQGELRGCIGTLEAHQPLAQDVREHACAAALEDYRFPPVTPPEVADLLIEISRLSNPEPLLYSTPEELLSRLRPGVDGVILRDGLRRATFLPQVWEKLPDPAYFLSHLCQKMGTDPDAWRKRNLQVFIYQVEEFHEAH